MYFNARFNEEGARCLYFVNIISEVLCLISRFTAFTVLRGGSVLTVTPLTMYNMFYVKYQKTVINVILSAKETAE